VSSFLVYGGSDFLYAGVYPVSGDFCFGEVFYDRLGVSVGEDGCGLGAFKVKIIDDSFPWFKSNVEEEGA
jgi:hypothetical protein